MPPSPGANDNLPDNLPDGIPANIDEILAGRFDQLVKAATDAGAPYVMVPIRIAQASAGRLRRLQRGGLIDG